MRPMLPTLTFDAPKEKEWLFEAKYDGFRAILHWDKELRLTSRNDKPLLDLFPEIKAFWKITGINSNRTFRLY